MYQCHRIANGFIKITWFQETSVDMGFLTVNAFLRLEDLQTQVPVIQTSR